ncbi:MAG: N-acetyltransferase [bacterium]|nr:N-acetyltransferase [bacterium]
MPLNLEHSIVADEARIASGAKIGAFCRIHPRVVIEDDVEIADHCVLGHPSPLADGSPLVIRSGTTIRSHSVFYEGSSFGPGLVTGHHVTVREGTVAGSNLQLGSYADVQGQMHFGDHVRTHSKVFVTQNSRVEDFAWLFPGVVFTDDPHPPSDGARMGITVRPYAVIAARACLMPGVEIGTDALVAAGSLVRHDVAPGTVVAGVPAQHLCNTSEIARKDAPDEPAYPWRRHFHRGYPDEIVARWKAEFGDG